MANPSKSILSKALIVLFLQVCSAGFVIGNQSVISSKSINLVKQGNQHRFPYSMLNSNSNITKKTDTSKNKIPFYGSFRYSYFNSYQNTNSDSIQINRLSQHVLQSTLGVNVKGIPVAINLLYDPTPGLSTPLRFNLSIDQEKLSQLSKNSTKKNVKFESYIDSLSHENIQANYNQKLIEIQLNKIQDSLASFYPREINADQLDSNTQFSAIDTNNILQHQYDSSSIRKLKDKKQSLESQLKTYKSRHENIQSIMSNDSLLSVNSKHFEMRKKINSKLDQAGITSAKDRIKNLQIGMVFPNFTRLSTHNSNITGLNTEIRFSKTASISTFAGWIQSQSDLLDLEKSTKTIGLLLEKKFFNAINIKPYFILNHRKQIISENLTLKELNNPIIGLNTNISPIQSITIGGELAVSGRTDNGKNKLQLPKKDNENYTYSVFGKINISQTKSKVSFRFSNFSPFYVNYLTPLQLKNSKVLEGGLTQRLFRSKLLLSSHIKSQLQTIDAKKSLNSNFLLFVGHITTNWRKFPNYFCNISRNSNTISSENEINHYNLSTIFKGGVNYKYRYRKTKIFTQIAYQFTQNSNGTREIEFHRFSGTFRIGNPKYNWIGNVIISSSLNASSTGSSKFLYNFSKKVNAGLVNRYSKSTFSEMILNGVSCSTSFMGFNLTAEISLVSSLTFSRTNLNSNLQLSYSF